MVKYIIKRSLIGIVTLFILITVTFFLTRLMPGNPFDGENISNDTLAQLSTEYGLNKPVLEQYGIYLANLCQGDLGISFKKTGVSVNSLIAQGAPATMSLGILAYVFALIVGTLIGIWESTTKRESVRGFLLSLATLGVSIPNFVLAILLLLVFGVWLKVLPVLGLDGPLHYILPVLSLAVYPIAEISRLVHSSYTEAMRMDFVTLSKAKGLPRRTIAIRHILKNAMIPVITDSGPLIAFLLTGSFVVESIFTIPGIGQQFVNSVSVRDYTVIMGLTIFVGTLVIVCNILCDIVCMLVDPSVKFSN